MGKRMRVNPENAEEYFGRAAWRLMGIEAEAREAALAEGRRMLCGLFKLVARDLRMTADEQAVAAAYEWLEAGRVGWAETARRVKQVILNVSVARLFGEVADRLSVRKRARARRLAAAAAAAAA